MISEALYLPLTGLLAALAGGVLLVALMQRRLHQRRHRELQHEFYDLRRQYASAQEDSRAQLDQLPAVILIFDRQWPKLLFANRLAREVFGCQTEEQLMERLFNKPDAWLPGPHSLVDFEDWLASARDFGMVRREWCFSTGPDESLWLDCEVGNTIFAGQPARLFSGVNIHHRKMESIADNLRERALFGINAGRPLDRLIEAASKLLEVQIPGTRCIVSLYDEQRDVLVSQGNSGFAKEFCTQIPSVPARFGATSIGSAAHTRARVTTESISGDHQWQGYSQLCQELNVDAAWSEPVQDQHGNLQAVITLFSSAPRKPDSAVIQQFSSVVSLLGLGIEREQWKMALEASSAHERFVREIGVEIVNVRADDYAPGLQEVARRIQAHYGLGALNIWQVEPDENLLVPVAGTAGPQSGESGASTLQVPVDWFEGVFRSREPKYVIPQDELYARIRHSGPPRPVLVVPLYSDAARGPLLGLLTVESRHQYVKKSSIEYLSVIGSVIKTSLINRRLMTRLSDAADTERRARQKLEGELDVARNIQMSMVPGSGSYLQQFRAWNIEAWLSPAKAVGGDFYELIALPQGRLLAAVGDVSDKGVPAALFMARTVSLLNFLARSKDGNLRDIAEGLNRELCRGNDACMFVTLVLVLVDLASGKAEMLSAGHTAPLQRFRGRLPLLWRGEVSAPLGLYDDVPFTAAPLDIPDGSSLVLYSDGVTEAFNKEGLEFGEDRLLNLGHRADGSGDSFLSHMRKQLSEYTKGAEQSDDITIMTINHHGF